MIEPDRAKGQAKQLIDDAMDRMIELSHAIHARPELGFEERFASSAIVEVLDEAGFSVECGLADMGTAFEAVCGDGPVDVVFCAEYDALPSLGHACGHNVVAASAVAGALALRPLCEDIGLRIRVMGCPAEEGGGGKIGLLTHGAFAGADAVMMVHPAPRDELTFNVVGMAHLEVEFVGRSGPSSKDPGSAVDALEGLLGAHALLASLRQSMGPAERVHGVIEDGGDWPGIVPDRAVARYFVRAADLDDLELVTNQVVACLETGASQVGAELRIIEPSPRYSSFRVDAGLAELFRRNAAEIGRVFPTGVGTLTASTDLGNVSQRIPAIHPLLSIDSLPAVNHTAGFAAASVSPSADAAIRDGGLAMAWTAIDLSVGANRRLIADRA